MLPTNQVSSLSSERWLITIHIETLAGSSFELLVSPHEQIQSIKRRIEQREGIPVSQQHLVWKSIELEDESCLNDHQIDSGATIRLVLAMRGGPVNTKRVPIEDSFIRDMSEYFESSRDDCDISSDSLPSANKNVTFLVLRDGDQLNFFQVIDRGDVTISPLSGSVSNASMYNTHEKTTAGVDREYDEKRQADDRRTKQKMEWIRSKLKNHSRKEPLPMRPPSATKANSIQQTRRINFVDKNSNSSMKTNQPASTSSVEQCRPIPLTYSTTNLSNSCNLSSTTRRGTDLLHEDDSDDDDDSHDEDDEQPTLWQSQQQQLLTSRSFSPAAFYQKNTHHFEKESSKQTIYHSHYQERGTKNLVTKHESSGSLDSYAPNAIDAMLSTSYPTVALGPVSQETAITAGTTASSTGSNASTSAVLVDYIPRISPTLHKQPVPVVARSSRILSAISSKHLTNTEGPSFGTNADRLSSNQEENVASNSEILYQTSHQSPMLELTDDDRISPTNGLTSAASLRAEKMQTSRKQTADIQSRNDTALSRPMWTDDDDQLLIGDEYIPGERTSTSHSMLFRHRNSSTSTTIATPVPTLPSVVKKSTLPSSTQKFYHHHQTHNGDSQTSKASPRSSMPIALTKYRRNPATMHLNTSPMQQTTFMSAGKIPSSDMSNNGFSSTMNGTESFNNEHQMLNKRIEVLKGVGKQSQSTASPPSPSLSKRNLSQSQQDGKSIGTTTNVPAASSSHNPLDNTTVTIESIGPKTVSALLRQNATIEPVDTSRGVGKHLYSLLTTVSKETTSIKTGHKHSSRDAVIEDRYKFDSKSTNPWSNSISSTSSTVMSNLPNTTTTVSTSSVNKLPPVNINRKSTSKCFLCKKKTGLATTYQCRCGSSFCSEHRYPEAHACAFDYKAEGKRLIERNNPLVTAPKLPKI